MSADKPAGATSFPAHEWLDSSAVAAMLGITRATVYRYKNSGRLPADAEVGVTPLWHVSTVEHYRDELAPRAIVARRNRDTRRAAVQHSNSGQDDGTAATCGECGEPIVYRVRELYHGSPSFGRWEDETTHRVHQHGAGADGVRGDSIGHQSGRNGEQTENEPSAGRWQDQNTGRAHHHGDAPREA